MQSDLLDKLRQPDGAVYAYESVFPATLYVNNQQVHDETRVLIVDSPTGEVHVVAWSAQGSINVVFDTEVTDYKTDFSSRSMTLPDGRNLQIRSAAGCGCGNPLKSWSPSHEFGVRIARVAPRA